jgi:phage gp29-like protein
LTFARIGSALVMLRLFSRKREPEIAPAIARAARALYRWPRSVGVSHAVYDEMQKDPLVRGALIVKKLGALAPRWRIREHGDGSRNEFIGEMLANMEGSVEAMLFDAMDALAKGYAVLEKVWGRDEAGRIVLKSAKPKDPSLFGFEVDEFLNILSLNLQVPGEEVRVLPVSKFIIYVHGQKYEQPYGEPDLLSAHRHWAIKRELVGQWAAHLEKFASPTIVGKFKRGLSEDSQAKLLETLEEAKRQSSLIHSDDIEVTLLEKQKEWQSGYLEAIDYHNREMARAILGQTLTTDDSARIGSLALGKVHLQVLVMQLAGLRSQLADKVMNEQVIKPVIDINYGGEPYPVFEFAEPALEMFRTGSTQ